MVPAGPPPDCDPRRNKGGPAVFLRTRRQGIGWPALLFSLGLHGVIMAAAAWLVGSQGSGGDAGDQLVDSDAASEPVPMLRPLPSQEQRFAIQPHRVKKLQTSNLPRLVAKTERAEVLMPKWEMAPTKPIEAPPPSAPKTAPAAPTAPRAVASSSPTKGTSTATKQRAAGKGSGTGTGSATIAAAVPKLVSSYPPPYPAQARRDHAEGTAVVKVSVDEKGRVNDCSIWTSTGHPALDTAALRAVKGWRFTPAVSASSSVLVKVTFRLS